MSTIDVRDMNEETVSRIRFAEDHGKVGGDDTCPLACYLTLENACVAIDDPYDRVIIKDKEHALNLIKALNKAIELGWLV